MYSKGGWRVRRAGAFNFASLGKWCWRMLIDKVGLWYLVLKSGYGEDGGRLQEEGRHVSSGWRSVM